MSGTSTGTQKYENHTYSSTGDYTIKITVNSGGTFQIRGYSQTGGLLVSSNTGDRRNAGYYSGLVTSVRVGNLVQLGAYAFAGCYNLRSVIFPQNMQLDIYGSNCFYGCVSLSSITLPSNNITKLVSTMFRQCSDMKSLSIPSNITEIAYSAFIDCASLQSLTIPSSVTSLGSEMFRRCFALRSMSIPSAVATVPNYFIDSCKSVQSLTIQNGVTSIGNYAFIDCYSIKSVIIPNTVTSIGISAFNSMHSLTSLTIPSSVTNISKTAFGNNRNIIEYHCLPTTPPTAGENIFQYISPSCKIYVPSASLSAYQSAENWSTYASYMVGE